MFLVALIIAVAPLSMAVPCSANSDVLIGTDVVSYPGYDLFFYQHLDGIPLYVAVPDNIFDHDIPMAVYLVTEDVSGDIVGYVYGSLSIIVESDKIKFALLGHSNRMLIPLDLVQTDFGFVLIVDYVSSELDGDSLTFDPGAIVHAYLSPYVDVVGDLPYSWSYYPAPPVLGVFSVFTGVGTWLSGAVQNISTMFWTAESGMTVLGYLAVASLAVAVILLIFYLIAGWLKFH